VRLLDAPTAHHPLVPHQQTTTKVSPVGRPVPTTSAQIRTSLPSAALQHLAPVLAIGTAPSYYTHQFPPPWPSSAPLGVASNYVHPNNTSVQLWTSFRHRLRTMRQLKNTRPVMLVIRHEIESRQARRKMRFLRRLTGWVPPTGSAPHHIRSHANGRRT